MRPIIGRARLKVILDVTSETLAGAVVELVEPGSTIVTDAWGGYVKLDEKGFRHIVSRIKGKAMETRSCRTAIVSSAF